LVGTALVWEDTQVELFTRIDHVGIACASLEKSVAFYESAFGLTVVSIEENEAQGVREAMMSVGPSGSYVQLLEPLREDSPVGKFLASRGAGIHHIGYAVDDISSAMESIAATGIRLLDARPRHGSLGASIAFLHPKDVGGVLTELVQSIDGLLDETDLSGSIG
jgi:methylmalonyl-CoA/ethylmalonyl-CoA epimerase